jgi:hypothetical protein
MITTNGKNIVAKYLLNQAPEFASHIAVGVGGQAYPTGSSATFLEDAKSLEFEVARVPVLSKGLLKELDPITNQPVEKIVFKAELPIEQRYQITEIGIFPANSNAVAGNFDSKIIATFDNTEPWSYSNNINDSGVVLYIGPVPIDPENAGDIGINNVNSSGSLIWNDFVFINSNSPIFEYPDRFNRGESPRYLNRSLVVSGSTSVLSASSSTIDTSSSSSYYIENNSINLNLGKNLPTDQIKLAFSVISKELRGVRSLAPDNVKIRLEFLNNTGASAPKAYVDISVQDSEIDDTRYKVVTKSISEFTTTENFSWSGINSIRIYTCVHDDENVVELEDYFVVYDGIRFENISSFNPLYSLVAAEYAKTLDENPILKKENSSSYIEYRLGIGVS